MWPCILPYGIVYIDLNEFRSSNENRVSQYQKFEIAEIHIILTDQDDNGQGQNWTVQVQSTPKWRVHNIWSRRCGKLKLTMQLRIWPFCQQNLLYKVHYPTLVLAQQCTVLPFLIVQHWMPFKSALHNSKCQIYLRCNNGHRTIIINHTDFTNN